MKFSILINTHNQEDYLDKAILSCVNQDFKDYEIIVCDTSDQKNNIKLKKIISNKKVHYYHWLSKRKQPEQNQMDKILFGFKKSKGDFICLMDGDDFFKRNKLSRLKKILNKKKISFNQDNPIIIRNKLIDIKSIKIKKYKENYLFNLFINEWPQIYGTSSIVVKKEVLKMFFKKAKPFNWKHLAIDVQLALFCKINFKISSNLQNLTKKNMHNNNLGEEYLKGYYLLIKKFWIRRFMQHKYYFFLRKEYKFSLDFLFTAVVYYLLKNL
jgi:glycosyltransferase involved in cell wall biosynthesis